MYGGWIIYYQNSHLFIFLTGRGLVMCIFQEYYSSMLIYEAVNYLYFINIQFLQLNYVMEVENLLKFTHFPSLDCLARCHMPLKRNRLLLVLKKIFLIKNTAKI